MAKNILILTGSPRVGGNSDALAAAFAEGAREAGHMVQVFDAGRASILPCRACDACSKAGKCVFNDDFQKLDPMLREADVIALVSPLYWYDVSAQLKLAIDKLKSFSGALHIRESVLLMCGAVEDTARFDGAVQVYKRITEGSLQWTDRGVILAGGCSPKGAIADHPALEQARALGKSL